MAQFQHVIITTKGQVLMAKMMAGVGNIHFTKINTSSKVYTNDQLEGLISLADIKQSTLVSKVTRENDATIKVEGVINNTFLTTGYFCQTVGIYANDPDEGEILYGITIVNGQADYISAFNGTTSTGIKFELVIGVGTSENVTLQVNPAAVAMQSDITLINENLEDLRGYIGYNRPDILGVKVNFVNKKFTRLAGAIGLTPGADFDNFIAYQRKRCNIANNGYISAYFGDGGYVEDGYSRDTFNPDIPEDLQVQVMVEQQPLYYKIIPLIMIPYKKNQWAVIEACFYISDKPIAGFKLPDAFQGKASPIYLAAYEGSRFIASAYGSGEYETENEIDPQNEYYTVDPWSDKLCSIANAPVLLAGRDGLIDDFESSLMFGQLALNRRHSDGGMGAIVNNPHIWQVSTIQHLFVTQLLFLIEYASFNSREAIGAGVNNANTAKTGCTSSLGNASGTAQGLEGYAVSYRGEENLWGNTFQYLEQSIDKGVTTVAGQNIGDNVDIYLPVSTPFDETAGVGHISKFIQSNKVFLPAELEGDSNLPIGDMCEIYEYNTQLLRGGFHPAFHGLFSVSGGRVSMGEFNPVRTSARLVYAPSNIMILQ